MGVVHVKIIVPIVTRGAISRRYVFMVAKSKPNPQKSRISNTITIGKATTVMGSF